MGTKHIMIHEEDTVMFSKLEMLASALRMRESLLEHNPAHKHTNYYVDTCYFDFGQNWLWTTVIACRDDGSSYQALYPVRQEKLYMAETFEDVLRVVGEIVNEVVKE